MCAIDYSSWSLVFIFFLEVNDLYFWSEKIYTHKNQLLTLFSVSPFLGTGTWDNKPQSTLSNFPTVAIHLLWDIPWWSLLPLIEIL